MGDAFGSLYGQRVLSGSDPQAGSRCYLDAVKDGMRQLLQVSTTKSIS